MRVSTISASGPKTSFQRRIQSRPAVNESCIENRNGDVVLNDRPRTGQSVLSAVFLFSGPQKFFNDFSIRYRCNGAIAER